ncbi:MAG: gamma carbonic anhydrase family protein [Spirochaetales bacterium]|nr:gamma carbonic anhydrase family protein [Spirochaetales bacterium]
MVHRIKNEIPILHESVFVAHNAEVAGRVRMDEGSSVWFGASVRGDIAPIEIGKDSNIQDGAVVHCDTDIPCVIGSGVTIGHGAIIHSATIGNNSLVGMGAVILNQAMIGEDSIIGAMSLVTSGKSFPPRSLLMGSPAKLVRTLTDEEVEKNRKNALHYRYLAASAMNDYQDAETV